MDDFVDTLTFGNVPQVKTVLASVAAALAVYQVATMAVGYGKVKLPFLTPRAASFAHRTVGDAILPITALVGCASPISATRTGSSTRPTGRRCERRSTSSPAPCSWPCWRSR